MKDWTGNSKTTFVQLGASSHSAEEREENDYYATDPSAIDDLLKVETFNKENGKYTLFIDDVKKENRLNIKSDRNVMLNMILLM